MTKHGEGKSVSSTSVAKRERARRVYLARKGKVTILVNYNPVDEALRIAGLIN
jgi:hypothetical protein